MAVEIPRRREVSMRLFTGKGDDGDQGMKDPKLTIKATVLEALQYGTTKELDNTHSPSPLIEILQHNCKHLHAIYMTAFKGARKVGVHIVCLQE